MKFLVKTQIAAIVFALLWTIYILLLAFLDQSNRAMQNINYFVSGFAIVIGVIYVVITKYFLERKWIAVPLILLTNLFLYQPLLLKGLPVILSQGYESTVHFFSAVTGSLDLMASTMGLVLGIIISRPHK